MGHALQDASSKKLKRMIALRRLGRIMGVLFAPALIAGVVLLILGMITWAIVLFSVGGGILLLALFIKLFTISVEKDASKKAVLFLQCGELPGWVCPWGCFPVFEELKETAASGNC